LQKPTPPVKLRACWRLPNIAFSVEDYYRMAETGVLRPDARVELLDGEIIDMSPIGPFHGGVVNRLTRLFTLLSKNRWLLSLRIRCDLMIIPSRSRT
jgi:Uma2 family endonuclease